MVILKVIEDYTLSSSPIPKSGLRICDLGLGILDIELELGLDNFFSLEDLP